MSDELVSRRPSLPAWMDAQTPVARGQYLRVGLGLGALKYAVDALVIHAFSGQWIPPLVYLMPLASVRLEYMAGVPDAVIAGLVLWTIPFAWLGLNWSLRRARDAGLPTFFGVFFLVPILNYLMIAALSLVPTRARPTATRLLGGDERLAWAAVSGTMLGAASTAGAFGVLAVGWSVYVVQQYGGVLFVGTPFAMGLVASFLLNLRRDHGLAPTLAVAALTVTFVGGFMLLLAMEGILCLAMAAPLGVGLAVLGAVVGRSLARAESRFGVIGPVVFVPILGLGEPPSPEARVHEVLTSVVVHAPAEAVWEGVVAFPEIALEEPPRWFFDLGVAYPLRATIDGRGVGALRRCEFSTGAFVEPITVWDPPRRLAFDVLDQPPTMHEWSPYRKVWAPHLDGAFRSVHGEFRIVPLGGGDVRLEGRTWYRFDMEPFGYWRLWGDTIVHAIHTRVLDHIRREVETRQ